MVHGSLKSEARTVESRIVTDPEILGGKPCIRGTRLSVEFVLELIGSGATADDIVKAYPILVRDDVLAAVQFAARSLRATIVTELEIAR